MQSIAMPMTQSARLPIFLTCPPGLESLLAHEALAIGFSAPKAVHGGVEIAGFWSHVWRANLALRGASHVLVRIGSFPAAHLAHLDAQSRSFPWAEWLNRDVPVRVEASCHRSRIYHSGAVVERVETALAESAGIRVAPDAELRLMVRISNNIVTFSIDTSGAGLHKRGYKHAVGKAPMRETMAALFLRATGYDGTEPVLDPMCGAGTFVIEAAEIAAGLTPGRARSFAFQHLPSFDPDEWQKVCSSLKPPAAKDPVRCFGFDHDAGAVRMSRENAARAGVNAATEFTVRPASALTRPDTEPGLVIVNPPYGDRIGNEKALFRLYGGMGARLLSSFNGWRVALVTTSPALAKATGLPFEVPGPVVAHGGLKVRLYQTAVL